MQLKLRSRENLSWMCPQEISYAEETQIRSPLPVVHHLTNASGESQGHSRLWLRCFIAKFRCDRRTPLHQRRLDRTPKFPIHVSQFPTLCMFIQIHCTNSRMAQRATSKCLHSYPLFNPTSLSLRLSSVEWALYIRLMCFILVYHLAKSLFLIGEAELHKYLPSGPHSSTRAFLYRLVHPYFRIVRTRYRIPLPTESPEHTIGWRSLSLLIVFSHLRVRLS